MSVEQEPIPLAQHEDLSTLEPHSFRQNLLKDVLLGGVVLLCFGAFMNYSSPEIGIGGVLLIATTAWAMEVSFKSPGFISIRGKAVVITGCDTGFGHLLAKHLANLGVVVFAGCLDSNGKGAKELKDLGSPSLHVLQMDVTSENQIKKCISCIHEKTNGTGVFGVVNNAGTNFLGDVELTTMQQFSAITNVNQLGMVRVTKAFIPDVRKNRGRIVNVTSVKGRIAEAFNAAYAMTKFAGEAFSDALRLEMHKFGVSVSIVEPGNFGGATGCMDMDRIGNDFRVMWEDMSEDVRALYGKRYMDYHIKQATDSIPTASFHLTPVLDAITNALFSNKPQIRYLVPGSSHWYDIYRWRILAAQFIPTSLVDRWLLRDISSFPPPLLEGN